VGPGIVPRLEVLEDRSLPSGFPTVTLSDGTVLQLVPASNDFASFISVTGPVYSNQIVQVTDSLSFSSWTAANSADFNLITIASLSQASVTHSSDARIVLIDALSADRSISSVLWLSPVADGVRTPATSYSIAVQTAFSPNNVSQSFTIAGFDANGNLTGGYNSAIQAATPPTNPLLLPSADNGKLSFVLNTPLDGPRIPFTNNSGPCWGCSGYFNSNGEFPVAINRAQFVSALEGIGAGDWESFPNGPWNTLEGQRFRLPSRIPRAWY
jgi:hypothetical protein